MLPDLFLVSVQRYKVKTVIFSTRDIIIKVIRFNKSNTTIEYKILNTMKFCQNEIYPRRLQSKDNANDIENKIKKVLQALQKSSIMSSMQRVFKSDLKPCRNTQRVIFNEEIFEEYINK